MYRVRKTFRFEAAHRLISAETKECMNLHGHSYKVEVFLTRLDLNKDGMVEDFLVIKEAVQPVIEWLDHSIILAEEEDVIQGSDMGKVVILGVNPTAEALAKYIHDNIIIEYFSPEVKIEKIRVHETNTGYAEFYPIKIH